MHDMVGFYVSHVKPMLWQVRYIQVSFTRFTSSCQLSLVYNSTARMFHTFVLDFLHFDLIHNFMLATGYKFSDRGCILCF